MNNKLIKALASEVITVKDDESWTDSLLIAEKFNKQHKDVLKVIKNLGCSEEFSRRNFAPSDYIDERGKKQPMFRISRDGFALLAMGFTGKEAMEWKEKYIAAFNWMEKQLRSKKINRNDPAWLEARANTIPVRKDFTAMLKPVVDMAVAEKGKGIEKGMYASYTRMLYSSFMVIEQKENIKEVRDRMNAIQLTHLATLETIARKVIDECINALTPWRDIYYILKEKALLFGSMIDKTMPGFNVKQLSVGINYDQKKIAYAPALQSDMAFSKQ